MTNRMCAPILTTSDKVDEIIKAIVFSGRTGDVGDGKIVVLDVDRVVRIRNSEENASAI